MAHHVIAPARGARTVTREIARGIVDKATGGVAIVRVECVIYVESGARGSGLMPAVAEAVIAVRIRISITGICAGSEAVESVICESPQLPPTGNIDQVVRGMIHGRR